MRISDWSSDVCSSDLQRRAVAAVGLVDPLDDLLASFVLEVDVDVRRLLALARDEPLEQELVLDRIDRGDPEQIADAAVRGRTASLAQDAAPPAFGDARIDRQEIGSIGEMHDKNRRAAGQARAWTN